MHLVQLFLPLADNDSRRFPRSMFQEVERELVAQFQGFTAYSRAPANGLWVSPSDDLQRDELVVYEVLAERLDRPWWARYRAKLEAQFRQESILVRATGMELL